MSTLLTIIAFVVIFSVLVLIHELGHFWAAKKAGIRVEEFGFGLPPRLFGKKIGETIYSLNLFPFGGFVRLYGEDPREEGVMKSKKSFAAKSLRQRFFVVIAGVVMNFFLAILLLTFGFSFGIQPLLVDSQDVFRAIDAGQVQIQSGVTVESVQSHSVAERLDFRSGDIIIAYNSQSILDLESFYKSLKQPSAPGLSLRIFRAPSFLDIVVQPYEGDFGLNFHDVFFLPRLVMTEFPSDSELARSGIISGDVLVKVNGKQIYTVDDYRNAVLNGKKFTFTVLRNYVPMDFSLSFPFRRSVIAAEVLPGSPAEHGGLQKNDRIVQVERWDIENPQDVLSILSENKDQPIQFLVDREGQLLTFYVRSDENRKVGILLAPLMDELAQMNFYVASIPTSILKIHDVRYSFGESFVQALRETYRLAVVTAHMFGNFISQVASQFEVPEGVAGPVGIVHMTSVFVKEGFLSLLRFTALLSLSLAVMNLLPFPGLDGGRLLFLVIEGIRGRPLHPRFEYVIHTVGFVVLILLILAVTYKDLLRIFA